MNNHKPDCNCVICRRAAHAVGSWRKLVADVTASNQKPETPDLGNAIVAVAQALHHLAYEIAKLDLRRK